jgi:NAD(P)-dependent dehydrogenase (short-subunit alcohol dehydrogenase family)
MAARLSGKVALIAGGTSGIGHAAAVAFAAAGARVVVAGRDEQRGAAVVAEAHATGRPAGGAARFERADLTRPEEVAALIAAVVRHFGRLDCAFNNAGWEGALGPLVDVSEEQFAAAVTANLTSVFLCLKHEIRQMLRQAPAGGAIVNTSSVNGLGGAPGGAPYSAAKAGVLALTKSAALEYATAGVRVNALVAGAFETPMLGRVFDIASGGSPEGRDVIASRYREMIAMRRIGRAEEAARAALWLCSDDASYVTGHSMIVDGGLTAAVR